MLVTPWITPIDSDGKNSLLRAFNSEQQILNLDFIRRDAMEREWRPVVSTGNESAPWRDGDVATGALVEVAIGNPDDPPDTGTFGLSFDGNSTGLTALNIVTTDATALQTALNANAAVIAAGGVTVEQTNPGAFIITFNANGARSLFVLSTGTLIPPAKSYVQRMQVGDASTREIQFFAFTQKYLAQSNDFTAVAAGDITADLIQAGDADEPTVYRITIDNNVKGGSWQIQTSQTEIQKVTPQPSSGAGFTVATWTVTTFSGVTIVAMNSVFFDLEDEAGPVRFWGNVNAGGVAPATPPGGRLVAIALVSPNPTGWTEAEYVFATVNAAIAGDSKFATTTTGAGATGVINVRAETPGVRTVASGGSSQFTVSLTTAGTDSIYQSTYTLLSDRFGTVALVFNVSGRGTIPTAALAAGRIVQIPITNSMTQEQVVDAIVAAFATDAEFTVTDQTTFARFTATAGGERITPENGTAPAQVAVERLGYTLSGALPINATAGDVNGIVGDVYTVSAVSPLEWELTANENGASTAITVNGSALQFAKVYRGTFNINTVNLLLTFAATTEDTITSTFEIQVTEPGELPWKAVQIPCTIRRDVIDASTAVDPTPPDEAVTLTGNLVYVDAVNGDDGTGQRGVLGKAFETPEAAEAAATTADTIVVYPGSHTIATALGTKNCKWRLMPGAQFIDGTGGDGIFNDNGIVRAIVVEGGQFVGKLFDMSASSVFEFRDVYQISGTQANEAGNGSALTMNGFKIYGDAVTDSAPIVVGTSCIVQLSHGRIHGGSSTIWSVDAQSELNCESVVANKDATTTIVGGIHGTFLYDISFVVA